MELPGLGEIKLFAGSGCPDLADDIAGYLGVKLSDWDIIDFTNGNIWIRLGGSVRGQDVFVIQSHSQPVHRNIMEMLIAIDCLKRDSAARITVVVPYMAYSQSDQKTEPRVPITSRLLADMIEVAGADRWITFDLHAGQIQGFYKIPGDSLTVRHMIGDYLKKRDLSNTIIVTTDLGYAKGGRKYADELGLPLAFVEKRRLGTSVMREALTLIGDVDGKEVIIVDDLVDTGGSIVQAVNVVRENGAGDVSLAFAHPVLSAPAAERLGELNVKEIITTDTLPIPEEKMRHLPNLTVLSVAELLGEVILRTHEGRSVGELFDE